jgi:hypothetical protein
VVGSSVNSIIDGTRRVARTLPSGLQKRRALNEAAVVLTERDR